ncbi:MAG: globin [Chloroflexi bacterium]|nr:globin [Chloroflexota bacterium]MYE45638.1 globin [Chloroflexota bacterium]
MTAQQHTPFQRLGGRDALVAIVETFYDRIEGDPELRPVFPPDLQPGRDKQAAFLEQWMGGEPRYSQIYGEPALRRRHRPFAITERGAERWLEHFAAALEAHEVEQALAREIMDALRPIALRMVNTTEVRTRPGA